MKFLLFYWVITWKLLFSEGMSFGGGSLLGGEIFSAAGERGGGGGRGWANFQLVEGLSPISPSRENPALMESSYPFKSFGKPCRRANRLTHPHEYILTPPVMCLQQLPVLHWMNNLLTSKICFTEFHNFFAFQKLLTCRSRISAD